MFLSVLDIHLMVLLRGGGATEQVIGYRICRIGLRSIHGSILPLDNSEAIEEYLTGVAQYRLDVGAFDAYAGELEIHIGREVCLTEVECESLPPQETEVTQFVGVYIAFGSELDIDIVHGKVAVDIEH